MYIFIKVYIFDSPDFQDSDMVRLASQVQSGGSVDNVKKEVVVSEGDKE